MFDLFASSPVHLVVLAMSTIPGAAAVLVVAARVRLDRHLGAHAPTEAPAVSGGQSTIA